MGPSICFLRVVDYNNHMGRVTSGLRAMFCERGAARELRDFMREVLIACGDVELLRQIVGELAPEGIKPIATKRGLGTAAKVAPRSLPLAIVHEHLEDQGAGQLLSELRQLSPSTAILVLTTGPPPSQGPFHKAIRYPVPGPVLRAAVRSMVPDEQEDQDLEKWRLFYREVTEARERQASQNYFEVLGVPGGAPHHVIVRAFDGLSLRYHPDRYNQYRAQRWGAAIFEEVNALYKIQTEAYSVLTDRKLRARYERVLESGELRLAKDETSRADSGPTSIVELSSSTQAKKFLKLAQSDLASSNWSKALQNLQFALSMDSGNDALMAKIAEVQAKLGG